MNKKKSIFKKSLLIYTIVLVLLALCFLGFVYYNLQKYENSLLDNVLKTTIRDLDKEQLTTYLKQENKNTNLVSKYQELTKREDYTFVLTDENVYDAYLDGRVLFTIHLKSLGEKTCLGLLQYESYEVESITPHLEKGLYYYKVEIPSTYTLYVNNQEYTENKTEEEYPNLSFMYYNDAMPKKVTYEITDLESDATITIKDEDGEIVNPKVEGVTYQVEGSKQIKSQEEAQEIIGDFDILSLAKNWSLFLSRDLSGASYGFSTISTYIIKDTEMWEKAYNWAHNIDITFISSHTLKNPAFTNERVENFVFYSKDAFSCEVYLEKHMVVKGEEQTDIMHDTLSFIKENGEWKLMNIKGITDGE